MYIANYKVTHRTAPATVLSSMALTEGEKHALYKDLLEHEHIDEAVILQTCNRFEVYVSGKGETEGRVAASEILISRFGDALSEFMVEQAGLTTLEHLFMTVSSLDSMIVGENQIQAQVKEALAFSRKDCYSGRVLGLLFQKALSVGKRVRTETTISSGKVSISSAAVDLAEGHAGIIGKKVMILGTGTMATLVAEYLPRFEPREIAVMGRTPGRIKVFCDAHSARSFDHIQLIEELRDTDVLFTATSCPRHLVTGAAVAEAMKDRSTPLTIVDIALPQDVEGSVTEVPNVQYHTVDDLRDISRHNEALRAREAEKVRAIVNEEIHRFEKRIQGDHINRFMAHLNSYTEEIRLSEVDRSLRMLGDDVEPKVRLVLDGLSRSIIKKTMYNFIHSLKSYSPHNEEVERLVRLFMGGGEQEECSPDGGPGGERGLGEVSGGFGGGHPAGIPVGHPAGVQMTGHPAGVQMTGHPAGVPMTGHPAGVPMTGHPAGVPMTGHPAGVPMGHPAGIPVNAGMQGAPADGPANEGMDITEDVVDELRKDSGGDDDVPEC